MKTEFLWTYTVHTCSFMAVHLLNINIVFEIHFYNIICTLPSSPYKSRTPFNVRLIHYIFTGQKNFHRFLHQNKSKKKKIVQTDSCKSYCPWSKCSWMQFINFNDHGVISCSVKTLHWILITRYIPWILGWFNLHGGYFELHNGVVWHHWNRRPSTQHHSPTAVPPQQSDLPKINHMNTSSKIFQSLI